MSHIARLLQTRLMVFVAGYGSLIAAGGEIRTVVGSGQVGYAGDGGAALQAKMNNPFGITRGPDGAMYVVEFEGNVVRRWGSDGRISTVVGSGQKGGRGDGGPALEAQLNQPHEVRFDGAGNMYLADMLNHRIRKVDAKTKVISTVAGSGQAGFGGDGGLATKATLNNPISIQLDSSGDLYICDIGNHRIRKVSMGSGKIETFAGNGGKNATEEDAQYAMASLNGPRTLDFDPEGNLWVALREGNQVWKLERRTGKAIHIAGTGQKGMTGNGGPAIAATLSGPKGLSVAPDGRVYVADTESHSVRVIDPKTGRMEAFVGDGMKGDGPDGEARACRLARPHGVFADKNGSVYIGDSENHKVREVTR